MANILANPLWEERTASAARAAGIPDEYLNSFYRQMALESGNFDPSIISGQQTSPAGARGLAQFMPGTMKDFPHDPTNWQSSLGAGAAYMAKLFHNTGNWGQAQAAYNMGPGNLQKFLGGQMSLPPETSAYLDTTGSASMLSGSSGTLPVLDVQSTFPSLSAMLGNTLQHLNDNTAELLGQAQSQATQANAQRDQYQKQLDQMAGQPAPQNDPNAEFVTRLMGGISQALSPRMGGQQVAENTMESRLQGIRDQRRQSMEVLSNKLQMAATEATRAGETAKAAGFMAKRDNLLKDLELHIQTYGAETDRQRSEAAGISAQADLIKALTSGNGSSVEKSFLSEGLQSIQTTRKTLEEALARTGPNKPKGNDLMNLRRRLANAKLMENTAIQGIQTSGKMPDMKAMDVLDQHVQDTIADAQAKGLTLQQVMEQFNKKFAGKNDENWMFGEDGIRKREFQQALMQGWQAMVQQQRQDDVQKLMQNGGPSPAQRNPNPFETGGPNFGGSPADVSGRGMTPGNMPFMYKGRLVPPLRIQ